MRREDKELKKAWKASAHLKPQKKKKAATSPKKRKAETDPTLSVEEVVKCTAKEAMSTLLCVSKGECTTSER